MAVIGVLMPDIGQSDGTWTTYDLNGQVATGSVYPVEFGQEIVYRAPYNSGFYTLTEGPGWAFICLYKTDVLSGTSSLLLEIGDINENNPLNSLVSVGVISSKDGEEVTVAYYKPSTNEFRYVRSVDGGSSFSSSAIFNGFVLFGDAMLVRLPSSSNAITLYQDNQDGGELWCSNDFGATASNLIPDHHRKQLTVPELHSHFAYYPVKIMSRNANAYTLDFGTGTNGSVTQVFNPFVSYTPWTPIFSFGSALFDTYNNDVRGVVLESQQESYWDVENALGGYPANAFDCYGDPIDKSAGPLENGTDRNSVIFNEDGTIGWYPIRTWNFLINGVAPVVNPGNQFFTAFQKTVETNFRP